MNQDTESMYSYYPEQVARIMAEEEIIFEEEQQEMESYIRGCA